MLRTALDPTKQYKFLLVHVLVKCSSSSDLPPKCRRGQCSLFIQSQLFEEDALEGAPEVLVEDGVDDGVEGRVGVAQTEGEGEARALHLPASRMEAGNSKSVAGVAGTLVNWVAKV